MDMTEKEPEIRTSLEAIMTVKSKKKSPLRCVNRQYAVAS